MNISLITDMVGISPIELVEIQQNINDLQSYKSLFCDRLENWVTEFKLLETDEVNIKEIIRLDYYDALTAGNYTNQFYNVQYQQALKWLSLGFSQPRIMLLLSHFRKLFIEFAEKKQSTTLAKGLCHVLDMAQSVISTVFTVVDSIERMKVHSHSEIERVKRSFSLVAAEMPKEIVQAYQDHQKWKLVTFNMALGRVENTEGFELSHKKCRLAKWLEAGGYKLIDPDRKASFDKAHERVHTLGKIAIEAYQSQQPESILPILTEMEMASDEVSDVLLDVLESEFVNIATSDVLTGLQNRRAFDMTLKEHLAFAKRHDYYIGLILLDIDWFKKVNDQYGHAVGDEVLIHVANLLNKARRTEEKCYRWGGEEFTVVTMDDKPGGARILAERIRALIEDTPYILEDQTELKITVSVGALCFKGRTTLPLHEVFAMSDRLMYQSKEKGRNQVSYFVLED